ncbi:MAG: hypothetical protein OXH65_04335 [Paracoccaceae bacterium]|nr:hypothetical protein [Paracoccaceae bacterium]
MTSIQPEMLITYQEKNQGLCFGDSHNQIIWPGIRSSKDNSSVVQSCSVKARVPGENPNYCDVHLAEYDTVITKPEYIRQPTDEDGGALQHLANIHVHLAPDNP